MKALPLRQDRHRRELRLSTGWGRCHRLRRSQPAHTLYVSEIHARRAPLDDGQLVLEGNA